MREPTDAELIECRRSGCTCLPDVDVIGVDARGLEVEVAIEHDDDCPLLIAEIARWN
jgi:hypothetical protein